MNEISPYIQGYIDGLTDNKPSIPKPRIRIEFTETPQRLLTCEWGGKQYEARNPTEINNLLNTSGAPPRSLYFKGEKEPTCPRCNIILKWQMDSLQPTPKRPRLTDSGYRCPQCYLWVAVYPSKWIQPFMLTSQ